MQLCRTPKKSSGYGGINWDLVRTVERKGLEPDELASGMRLGLGLGLRVRVRVGFTLIRRGGVCRGGGERLIRGKRRGRRSSLRRSSRRGGGCRNFRCRRRVGGCWRRLGGGSRPGRRRGF